MRLATIKFTDYEVNILRVLEQLYRDKRACWFDWWRWRFQLSIIRWYVRLDKLWVNWERDNASVWGAI